MEVEQIFRNAANAVANGNDVEWAYIRDLCDKHINTCHIRQLDTDTKLLIVQQIYSHVCVAEIEVVMMLFEPYERAIALQNWTGMSFQDIFENKRRLQTKFETTKRRILSDRINIMKALFKQSEFAINACNLHIYVKSPTLDPICFGYIEVDWLLYSENLTRAVGEHFLTIEDMQKLWKQSKKTWTLNVHISQPSKYHKFHLSDNFTTIGIHMDTGYRPIHHIMKEAIYECDSV